MDSAFNSDWKSATSSPSPAEPGLRSNGLGKDGNHARVVVVEDNSAIAAFISEALQDELGCHPVVVGNGGRALELLQDSGADAVILDIDLPGLSGLDVFDRLRSNTQTQRIPIVFMSAGCHDAELAARAITDCLNKPFDLDDLISAVSRCLKVEQHVVTGEA